MKAKPFQKGAAAAAKPPEQSADAGLPAFTSNAAGVLQLAAPISQVLSAAAEAAAAAVAAAERWPLHTAYQQARTLNPKS